MANAKLKCKKCREYFPRDQIQKTNIGNMCSDECKIKAAIEKGNKDREKAKKKKNIEFKKKFNESDVKLRKKAAQKAFNAFIRERDKDQPCISCGRYHEGRYDAGHYKTIGGHSQLRFNEDNCHKQCHWNCNINLSGNIENYRIRLVEKIGLKRVEALEGYNAPIEYTCDDYKEIELYYKEKLKQLTP